MKKSNLVISFLVLVALFLTGCGGGEEAILSVNSQQYTKNQLETLGTISVDYTNKDGETSTYAGVPLTTLLEDADVSGDGSTLIFTAADDYQAEIALDEVLTCSDCIVAFDNDILRIVMPEFSSKLQVKDLVEISVQ